LAKAPRPASRSRPAALWLCRYLFYVLPPRFQGPGIVRSARDRNPSSSAASPLLRFASCATARLPRSPSLARNDVQGRFVSLPGAKQACPRQGGGSNLPGPWR